MSKKDYFLMFLLFLCGNVAYSQTFQFAKNLGGIDDETCLSIAVDASGNVYSTGWFEGTADFDPGPNTFDLTASAFKSIYVSKLDPNGNFIWALDFGHDYTNEGFSIKTDNNGNVYIAGQFQDTTDFDPGPSVYNLVPNGWSGAFILKLDSNGNFIWAKDCGGSNSNAGNSLTIDQNGNVYLIGEFGGTGDFDPGSSVYNLTAQGIEDAFILKLDALGNFIWAKQIGQTSYTTGESICTDGSGNVLVTGTFSSTVDFDPGPGVFNLTSLGSTDVYVLKLDSTGNFIWAKSYGSQGTYVVSKSMDADTTGNVYVTGTFNGTVDFDPGPVTENLVSTGNQDAYAIKLDTSGNYVWAINMGGTSTDLGSAIKVQPSGDVYIAGSFYQSADLDPSPAFYNLTSPSQSDYNMFVSKVDNDGNFEWAKNLYANYTIFGNTITLDAADNIYIGGRFYTSADFDPGPTAYTVNSNGGYDAYIVKFKECGNPHSTVNAFSCDSVTVNGMTYYQSGSYTQFYNNTLGCDSNIVVNVAIGTNSISQTACDSFVFGSNVLYNSGSYVDTFQLANNCDSIVNLTLTILNSTTNSITQSGCDSLVVNGQTYTASGTYTQTFINSQGCDSILTLNLTVDNPSTNSITQSGCDSLVINGQTYSASGTYNQTLINSQGCDSILTLSLTINSAIAVVSQNDLVLSATPSGATYQWLRCNPYEVLTGETSSTYVVTSNGEYAVIVTQNGCSDTSNCVAFTDVGLEDLFFEGISIYPNPTNEKIVVTTKNEFKNAELLVFNMLGELIYKREELSGTELEIDLRGYAKGLYTLELKEGHKVSRVKVMKQ
ncbi:MAG: SBBP repeat-containing protein [Crocinitomicaceae bacterium]